MKLVDILARGLKDWPEDCEAVTQDSDSYVVSVRNCDADNLYFDHNAWSGQGGSYMEIHELADDHKTSIVTRAEWQAAVDALNAPKVVEWGGVGLPPVGVDCEVENEVLGGWDRAEKILAHSSINGKDVAVFQRGDLIAYAFSGSFRPIRTAEQVAAEEREKAIDEMSGWSGKTEINPATERVILERLYDAGYRKQVAK